MKQCMPAPECGKLIKNSQKMLLALMKMFAAFFNQQSWFPNAKGNVFKVFILNMSSLTIETTQATDAL